MIAKQSQTGNTQSFKKFLKKILRHYRHSKGKITIALDNLRYHHAKSLKPFLENNKTKLELMFLPPYSIAWQFLKLEGQTLFIDSQRYGTANLPQLLGAIQKVYIFYK